MLDFAREHTWFLTFWGMIVLLSALEFLFPRYPEYADRARRWPTNLGLGILNGLIVSLAPVLTVWSAQWAASHGIGLLNWVAAPWWLALLGTVLIRSIAQYAFHRYLHKNPILWRLHRVHHCDVHLDASSALRFHPFEMMANIAFLVPVIMVCGLSPGFLVVYETVAIVASLLTHMNVRIPEALERNARRMLVTPGLHRFHHSENRAEADSNYGDIFSFWDRLFGTYCGQPRQAGKTLRFGLEDVSEESAGSFERQLTLPWRA